MTRGGVEVADPREVRRSGSKIGVRRICFGHIKKALTEERARKESILE